MEHSTHAQRPSLHRPSHASRATARLAPLGRALWVCALAIGCAGNDVVPTTPADASTASDAAVVDLARNREAVLEVSRAIAAAQLGARADELLAPDFRYHGPANLELDRAGYVGYMAGLNAAFTDMHMTFTQVVAEGDMVGVHYTNTFRHTGVFQSVPATGRTVTITGTFVRQVRAGRVVAEWDNPDLFALLTQIGVIPSPGGP